jgi:hypothetical protein
MAQEPALTSQEPALTVAQASTTAIPIQASALLVVREVGSLQLIMQDASTATTGTHLTFQERNGLQKKDWT